MRTKVSTKTGREEVSFSGQTIYLGLDVHKKNWSVSVYLGEVFVKTFHQESSGTILKQYLDNNFPCGRYEACYEAGFCGFSVYRELTSLGIGCIVVNAADVPQTNKGTLSKTDASDSKRLGTALAKGLLKGIYVPDRVTEADRHLIRYRKKIQVLLQAKRNSLKSLFYTAEISIPPEHNKSYWTNNFITWIKNLDVAEPSLKTTISLILEDVQMLRSRLLQTNREIRALSKSEKYAAMFTILTSTPGIGLITAMTLLTEVGEIERFDNFDKFNSFIGLCPSEFSSGEAVHKGKMTPRGNKAIRPLIIEAAWTAVRADPALTLKFEQLIQTRTRKRAIVIIARKLLSRIYTIWKRKQTYEKGIVK